MVLNFRSVGVKGGLSFWGYAKSMFFHGSKPKITVNFVNRITTSTYKTPGIFIISQIMKIPGLWSTGVIILFSKLKMKWYTAIVPTYLVETMDIV